MFNDCSYKNSRENLKIKIKKLKYIYGHIHGFSGGDQKFIFKASFVINYSYITIFIFAMSMKSIEKPTSTFPTPQQ